jgi:arylsulfatase A-like enzyme
MDRFLRKSGTYDTELLHRQTLAYYYGYVSQIDHNIGLVLQELEKSGLAGNTIVVYTADHGEMMAEHGLWTKCATGYEPTIRVPMIIRLPGIVPAGTRVNELACSIDLLPTLMEAAGLNIPVNVQGKSLLPLAQGKAVEWRKYAVSELGSSVDSQVVAITSTTRKYVRFKKGGKLEYEQLFDLVKDPWETQNVLSDKAYAGVQEEFKKALADWEATTPAAKPIPLGKKKGRAGEAAE